MASTAFARWQVAHGQRLLDDAVDVARAAGVTHANVAPQMLFAPVIPTLIEQSAQSQMLVVGSRGHGPWARALLGSVSSSVVRHAHCAVAILHDEDPTMLCPTQAPVLVGIDGSPASELAIAIAFDEASRRDVGLIAMHSWSDVEMSVLPLFDWPAKKPAAERMLADRLLGWQERYPDVAVRRIVECDQPAYHLTEASKAAQLVVVGSHGRGGFAGMALGSVSLALTHSAHTPVIVARRPITSVRSCDRHV